MSLSFGNELTPHDFDSLDERKAHRQRINDVNEIFDDASLSDDAQKDKMEALGFTRYDDPVYSPTEQLFWNIDMLQYDWETMVFSDLLQPNDCIISEAQRENFMSIDPKPLPSYFTNPESREHKSLQFLLVLNDAMYDSGEDNILFPDDLNKNPALRKFLIAVWMFVLGIVKERYDLTHHLTIIDTFLSKYSQNIGTEKLDHINKALSQCK